MEQLEEILSQIQAFQDRVGSQVEELSRKMQDIIQQARDAVENVHNNTQKAVEKKVQECQEKLDKFHAKAQEEVDKQIDKIREWADGKAQEIQDQVKRQQARALMSVQECATKIKLPEEMLDKFVQMVPDVPISIPSIPSIQIPKPDLEAMLSDIVPDIPDPGSLL